MDRVYIRVFCFGYSFKNSHYGHNSTDRILYLLWHVKNGQLMKLKDGSLIICWERDTLLGQTLQVGKM